MGSRVEIFRQRVTRRREPEQGRGADDDKDDGEWNSFGALLLAALEEWGRPNQGSGSSESSGRPCWGVWNRDEEAWKWESFEEVGERIKNFAVGLGELLRQLPAADAPAQASLERPMVGICAPTRPEWLVADLGCALEDLISVPLPEKARPGAGFKLSQVLETTGMRCIVCDEAHLLPFLSLSSAPSSRLSILIQMEGESIDVEALQGPFGEAQSKLARVFTMGQVCSLGRELRTQQQRMTKVESRVRAGEDHRHLSQARVHTILFTSGSTGAPKGTLISDEYWRVFNSVLWGLEPLIHLSFMPFSHASGRTHATTTLINGGQTGFHLGAVSSLFDSIRTLRPTFLNAPPRLWNVLYSDYQTALMSRKKLWLQERRRNGIDQAAEEREWQKVAKLSEDRVIAEVRDAKFGKNPQFMVLVSGGSRPSAEVQAFLQRCFPEIPVTDGYGASECGAITINGMPCPGTNLRLVDVPELGYGSWTLPHPTGEICVRSRTMFLGYFKDDEATTEALFEVEEAVEGKGKVTVGWYRTGDIGEQQPDGTVRVIDRKKNIFKLAQGEFVVPEALETQYQEVDLIDQIFIYGDSTFESVVAVIIPNVDALILWWKDSHPQESTDLSFESLIQRFENEITRHYYELLSLKAKEKGLRPFEIPRVLLLEGPEERFTAENGRLTTSLKLCRPELIKLYKSELEALYQEHEKKAVNKKQHQCLRDDDVPTSLDSLLQLVREAIRCVFGTEAGQVDKEERGIIELGGDSLTIINLQSVISSRLGISIPVQLLMEGDAPQGIAARIAPLIGIVGSEELETNVRIDCKQELDSIWADLEEELDSLTTQLSTCDDWERPPQKALLTGATGFLGGHLLFSLLEKQPTTEVYCIVRASTKEEGENRLRKVLQEVEPSLALDFSRIKCIPGDLSIPGLDLAEEDFDELCSSIDVIYHAGAVVSSLLPYQSLRNPNVFGTLSLLRIACTGRPKPLHFISTAGFLTARTQVDTGAERDDEAVDMESTEIVDSLSSASGYTQSKWVAEALLQRVRKKRRASTPQLPPISIFRPGSIAPAERNGHSNPVDWLTLFLCGCLQLGLRPEVDVSLDMIPAQFVASTIAHLTLSPSQAVFDPPAIHFVHPSHKTSLNDIWKLLQQASDTALSKPLAMKTIPLSEWLAEVQKVPASNRLYLMRPLFAQGFPSTGGPFKLTCKRLPQLLRTDSISIPCLESADYWARVLLYWVNKKLI